MAQRAERREKRRLIDARFPQIKRLEEFRFADNPKIPQATIAALAEGSWINDRESVILIGDSGTGKTHLVTALAVCACHQGRRVRFTTLAAWPTSCRKPTAVLARRVSALRPHRGRGADELGYWRCPRHRDSSSNSSQAPRTRIAVVTTNLPGRRMDRFSPTPPIKAALTAHPSRALIDPAPESCVPPRPNRRKEHDPDRMTRAVATPLHHSAYGRRAPRRQPPGTTRAKISDHRHNNRPSLGTSASPGGQAMATLTGRGAARARDHSDRSRLRT